MRVLVYSVLACWSALVAFVAYGYSFPLKTELQKFHEPASLFMRSYAMILVFVTLPIITIVLYHTFQRSTNYRKIKIKKAALEKWSRYS